MFSTLKHSILLYAIWAFAFVLLSLISIISFVLSNLVVIIFVSCFLFLQPCLFLQNVAMMNLLLRSYVAMMFQTFLMRCWLNVYQDRQYPWLSREPFSERHSSLSIDTQPFMFVDFQSFATTLAMPPLEHSLPIP
jgi:hypothetical protein